MFDDAAMGKFLTKALFEAASISFKKLGTDEFAEDSSFPVAALCCGTL